MDHSDNEDVYICVVGEDPEWPFCDEKVLFSSVPIDSIENVMTVEARRANYGDRGGQRSGFLHWKITCSKLFEQNDCKHPFSILESQSYSIQGVVADNQFVRTQLEMIGKSNQELEPITGNIRPCLYRAKLIHLLVNLGD